MVAFPSVDTLISGSKTGVGITANWDVVVSYSLESLNSVLQKIWTSSVASTTVEVVTVSTNEDDEEYHTKWWLRLGAPTLQFTRDGKASLCMPLDGKRQVVEKSESGKEKPIRDIPANTYALYAVIPLGVVSAKSGAGQTAYEFKGSSGSVIRFDEDPNAELHVVLNFQTTKAEGAVYTVGLAPGVQQTSNPPVVTDTFSVGLRDKLAAWISDPSNISAIQYALAVVNKKPVPQATYLTPESLSFTVYSSDKNPSVACLSIYMQTQGSGFEPGNMNRSFNLPNAGNTNSYPIPSGYTASIIVRHDVFAQKFLRDSMLALQGGGKSIFKSVTVKPTTEGFALTASINSGAVADLGNASWFGGGFHVDKVDWDFGSKDLSFSIKDAKASWSYYFKPEMHWSESSMGDRHSNHSYGRTSYEMKLDKSGLSVFEDVSDVGLVARIRVDRDYWQTSIQAWDPGFLDRLNGASGSVPDSIEKGLKKIDLPAFSHSLALEYFATTNVFAPGKHMLSIGGASDVYTPYDVIILGNVLETAALSPPKLNFHAEGLLGAMSANKNITDFINDLSLGRPIMRQLTACALSDTPVEGVLAKAGYNVSDDDITTAPKAADAGPQFDPRFVAGLYSFSSPADLTSTRMTVDGASGRIYIGSTKVNTSIDSEGNVSWTWGNYLYSITFSTPYNSKGTADPKTFQGTRKNLGSETTESVSGTEITPKPSDDFWTNTPPGLAISWVATVFSTGLAIYLWLSQKRADRRNAGRDKLVQAAALAVHLAEDQARRHPLPENALDNILNDFQDGIEGEARDKAIDRHVINEDDPVEYDPAAASEAAKDKLRSLLKEAVTPYLMQKLSPILAFIGPEAVTAAIKHRVETILEESKVLDRFKPDSPYIIDIVDSVRKREEASESRSKEQSAVAEENLANAEVKTIQNDALVEKKLLAKEEQRLRDMKKDITEAEMMEYKEYKDVADRVKALKDREFEALDRYQKASEKRKEATEDREKRQAEKDAADHKAKETAKDAFKKIK
ncbi:hypothetical protein FBEOM_12554 [Fusarium beomiforme]|uniref:Uncharacterized protein n=1 Tax=Fusarium beomiforme TaxID=44412 RepID=A0A9P5A7D6_9HYPO|nr:hypothetical protein FBEOM_12554 [Fusarium beomiforme]